MCYSSLVAINFIIDIDAVTIVPPSITACPGQTVLTFNCTANVNVMGWNVFTPVRNYTNLPVPGVDGDVVISEVSRTLNPLQLVSSLTITVTAELNGSEVQCFAIINGSIIMDYGFIYFAGINFYNYNRIKYETIHKVH